MEDFTRFYLFSNNQSVRNIKFRERMITSRCNQQLLWPPKKSYLYIEVLTYSIFEDKKKLQSCFFSQVIYFDSSVSVSDNQLGHFLCKDSQLCTAISLLLAQNFKQFMFAYSSDPFSNFQTNSQVVERLMALNHSVESSKRFFPKIDLAN